MDSTDEPRTIRPRSKWLFAYENILLPIHILVGLCVVGEALNKIGSPQLVPPTPTEEMATVIGAAIDTVTLGLVVAIFWGLKLRRLWAWRLNFVYLVLLTLTVPLAGPCPSGEDLVSSFGLVLTVWAIQLAVAGLVIFLPNAVYFHRRKHLFF